jgi:hypothetical protein
MERASSHPRSCHADHSSKLVMRVRFNSASKLTARGHQDRKDGLSAEDTPKLRAGHRRRGRSPPQAGPADRRPDDPSHRHRGTPPLYTTNPGDYAGLEKLIRVVPVTYSSAHRSQLDLAHPSITGSRRIRRYGTIENAMLPDSSPAPCALHCLSYSAILAFHAQSHGTRLAEVIITPPRRLTGSNVELHFSEGYVRHASGPRAQPDRRPECRQGQR